MPFSGEWKSAVGPPKRGQSAPRAPPVARISVSRKSWVRMIDLLAEGSKGSTRSYRNSHAEIHPRFGCAHPRVGGVCGRRALVSLPRTERRGREPDTHADAVER